MICQVCQRDFPRHLLNDLRTGNEHCEIRRRMCPLCALDLVNDQAGLPPGTPFRGSQASAMYLEAMAHVGQDTTN